MKKNGYGESEKEMPFPGEGRQGQALRIMEALSGVDEELLERSENKSIQDISGYEKRKDEDGMDWTDREEFAEGWRDREELAQGWTDGEGLARNKKGGRKQYKSPWQYVRPWAAVLCLAIVGALGWGGYHLTQKVDKGLSGGNNNAMRLDAIEMQDGMEEAAPEDAPEEAGAAGAAGQAAEDTAAQKMNDQAGQENAGDSDMGVDASGGNTADGASGSLGELENFGLSQRQSEEAEEKSEEAASDRIVQEGVSKESAAEESVMIDSDGCPAVNLKKLTEEEARNQDELGDYLPDRIPRGYAFESASCNLDRQEANLTVTWSRGMDSIMWTVVEAEALPETVDIDAAETYDQRLYEIPYAETVPQEYQQSVDNPTFA